MNDREIDNIIIVGGGIAGTSVAAAITKSLPNSKITLIETRDEKSEALSMLPQTLEFHHQLGLDERELMRATQATFKLATIYQDWNNLGHHYIQPLGAHGAATEFVSFQHFAIKMRQLGDTTAYGDYALTAVAANNKKFMHPQRDPQSIFSTMAYSLHLDATLYQQYLANFAQHSGVTFRTSSIIGVGLRDGDGFIESVTLATGECIKGELFIDCSGSEGALIEKALGIGFEDWSDWLAANRVLSLSVESKGEIMPYTQISGKAHGWLRQVPLLNRVETEFVFNDQDLSDTEATGILTQGLAGDFVGEPRLTKFRSGQRRQHWYKNCIAFGAAAGAFESLEVSNLQLVQKGVQRLISLFPDQTFKQTLADEYNRLTKLEYDNVRDYTILHYLSATRKDSCLWGQWRHHRLPTSLENKVSLFNIHGHVASYEQEIFRESNRAATFIGLEMWPENYDPFLDGFDFEELKQGFRYMRDAISETVTKMPGHRQYIEKYCESTG